MIDAYAGEGHFVDHLQPVWAELAAPLRGTFYVARHLLGHAHARGVDAVPVDSPLERARIPSGPEPLLLAGYGDMARARACGRSRFAFLEHGAGQSYAGDPAAYHRETPVARHHSYPGGEDRDDVALFMVPNDHAAARWREAYPTADVRVVGSPVIDQLPERDRATYPGPTVALGFHWDCTLVPETGSAVHDYRQATLRQLAERFHVIGHGHPRRRDLAARYRAAGIEHVPDWREVCRRADVYACDNSSTLFEFAATGRPVVVLNASQYRRRIEHGLRFWSAASIGLNVDRPGLLGDTLEAALADPVGLQEARAAALALVYRPLHGGARLAAEALLAKFGD